MVTNIFTNGTVADATKVNTNFTDVETSAMKLGAQNAYQTLQANNVFQNKDFLFADEFVTSAGTNGTKTGGTAVFSNSNYTLSPIDSAFINSVLTNSAGVGLSNSFSYTGNSLGKTITQSSGGTAPNNYGTQSASYSEKEDISYLPIGSSLSFSLALSCTGYSGYLSGGASLYIGTSLIDSVVQPASYGSVNSNKNIKITNDGTNYLVYINSVLSYTLPLSDNFLISNTNSSSNSSYGDGAGSLTMNSIMTTGYQTPATAICNTNTKTLDGTENSLVVYADKTTPTNTTITLDISDGTTTLSAQPLNSVIDISTLGTGTLSLTFNLATTDTTVTPTLLGYGGSIL